MKSQCLRTICLLLGLGGRGSCDNQGHKDLDFLCDFHLCLQPLPSPPQVVLHCPTDASVCLQAVDAHLISPPCSPSGISIHSLTSVHPHPLFLETQGHGLISYSFWMASCTQHYPLSDISFFLCPVLTFQATLCVNVSLSCFILEPYLKQSFKQTSQFISLLVAFHLTRQK